jgi:hypothetical protein
MNHKYLSVWARRKLGRLPKLGTIDYSQLGEQMVILNILERLDRNAINEVYLDIGAFHPFRLSNTYQLYLDGWRGVIVEPNPHKTALFRSIRPRDVCLTKAVIPDAWDLEEVEMVASGPKDACESINPGLNKNAHLDQSTATHKYTAKTIRISEVLQYCSDKLGLPALLSIDIEGLEGELTVGVDFRKYPVAILCIEHFLREFTESLSILDYRSSAMVSYLEKCGYELVSVCGISLIFANKKSYVPFG